MVNWLSQLVGGHHLAQKPGILSKKRIYSIKARDFTTFNQQTFNQQTVAYLVHVATYGITSDWRSSSSLPLATSRHIHSWCNVRSPR